MARFSNNRSRKAGLPPGTLLHIGERSSDNAEITLIEYDSQSADIKSIEKSGLSLLTRDTEKLKWININGLHQLDIIEEIGKCFGIHNLVLEDIANTGQRPKYEEYGDYVYIVARMLYTDDNLEVVSEQVSIILGMNYVITFKEKDDTVFEAIKSRIQDGIGRIRRMGADYLVYSMIDVIVDNYFIILEELGDRLESLENRLLVRPSPKTLKEIQFLKREMLFINKSVRPLREVVGYMERAESDLIKEQTNIYLRDVYDHIIEVTDMVDTYRDILSGMLDIYLSSVSNGMNQVMKVLTIISTLFMPITFIAGLYGMNFENMPEIRWTYGYPVVLAVMAIICCAMIVYFKKKKWL